MPTQINIAAPPTIATINPADSPVSLAIATPNALLLLDFTLVVEDGVGVPVPVGTEELDVLAVVPGILVVKGKFVTLLAEAKTGS
jgi:hypothetical protein